MATAAEAAAAVQAAAEATAAVQAAAVQVGEAAAAVGVEEAVVAVAGALPITYRPNWPKYVVGESIQDFSNAFTVEAEGADLPDGQ